MILWGFFDSVFSMVVSLLFLLTVIITIIMIILDNRNPFKTLAWVLVLVFVPIVGLVLYFFFGQDTRKEKLIGKKGFARLSRYPMMEFQIQESFKGIDEKQYQLMRFFHRVNGSLPFDGNAMEIYQDGYSMLQALLSSIKSARNHIHVEFYIFEDDAVGRLVKDALIDKAREGVEVRVLYDDVGCWKVSHLFYDEMRESGIEVRGFLKVRFPRFARKVNFRNHRKMVVIDGMTGFVGGMNIAERYLKGVSWGVWRDVMMKVEGKAVYGIQTAFLTDWYAVDHSLITSSSYFPKMPHGGSSLMQIVTSDPVGEWRDIMQGLLLAITSAQRYFYIQTPYLLPTDTILVALKTIALAGVDVRIMIPEKSDSRIIHWGTLSYLSELMEAGVKVYMYQKGFLHSKLVVCDDCLATVGSTNMDFRSFESNFEVNAFMFDRTSALRLKDVFLSDQKDARLLQPGNWRMRPWSQKVKESIIRLFAPLL